MKKIIISAVAFLSAMTMSAQLRMNTSGQIELGKEIKNDAVMSKVSADTLSAVRIMGPHGTYGAGGVISFGDQSGIATYNVGVGEYSTDDTDILQLHGKNGLYITSADNETVASFDVNKGDFFRFNTAVSSDRLLVPSDNLDKEGVEELAFDVSIIKNIVPVTYSVKASAPDISGSGLKAQDDIERFSQFYAQRDSRSTRYGFVPEDIENVFPELVYTDSAGAKYIDYVGLIPVMFKIINDMQDKIDYLESMPQQSAPSKAQGKTYSGLESTLAMECKLFQNTPNPFSDKTTITFSLSSDVKDAAIYIYDLHGLQKATFPISLDGSNAITIDGATLPAGMYIYTLIADGVVIDSKRMILTK